MREVGVSSVGVEIGSVGFREVEDEESLALKTRMELTREVVGENRGCERN